MAYQRFREQEMETVVKPLDLLNWSRVLDKNEGVRKRVPRRADKYAVGDMFQILHQFNPVLKDEAVDPAMAAWLKAEMAAPEIQELRSKVMGDGKKSAFAAVKLFSELMRRNESALKSVLTTNTQLELTKALASKSPEMAAQTEKMIKKVQQQLADQISGSADVISGNFMEEEQNQDNLSHSLKEASALRKAALNVIGDMEAVEEFASITIPGGSGWGDDGADRLIEFGLDESLMSKMRNQDEFREILKEVGRLRRIAGKIKSRKPKPSMSRVGITTGNDLKRLIPQELVYLNDPELEDIFWLKLINKKLTLYENKKRQPEGKGAMVLCMDVSGSMSGLPERMSKAMIMQLVRTAFEQKRRVGWLLFGDRASQVTEVKTPHDLLALFGNQSHKGLGHGTHFSPPLERAMEFIKQDEVFRTSGDIVFLTDGYGPITETTVRKFEAMKEEDGTKFIGTLFSGRWDKQMKRIMDCSLEVDNAGNLEWAEEFMEQLI